MARRVGIFLGRDRARAALVAGDGGAARALATAEAAIDPDAWSGAPEHLVRTMSELAAQLPSGARRADCPVAISVPDPLATEDRLTFRDLPASEEEIAELVRFRIARDHRKSPADLACAWQKASIGGSEVELVVRVLPAALVDAVVEAALAAGFVPSRVDTWGGYAINAAASAAGGSNGAWLWSDGGWWTLMCWRGAPEATNTYLQSAWHEPHDDEAVAERALRTIAAFAMRGEIDDLPIYLDAPPDRLEGIEDRLARRDGQGADPADNDEAPGPAPAGPALSDPALCVAAP